MKQAFLRLAPAAIIIAATIAGFCARRKDRRCRYRLDDRRDRPGADDDDPGPCLVLCRHGAQEERARHHGAKSWPRRFLVSILWAFVGYTLAFTGEGAFIGTLDRIFLNGVTLDAISPLAKTIPESLFMIYQMTFAIITVALVAGSVADRLRFSAFLLFCAFWLLLVYVPIAHWVWGGGFLGSYGLIDFAGGTVVHLNAGVAGLVAAYVLGARRGYGSENLAPHDLALAVIGIGLLWVGWFGFNGGSALGANSRAAMAIVSTHLAASAGAFTWMALEWWTRGKPSVLGMISGAVAGLGTITPASGFVLPMQGRADRHDRRRVLLLGLHLAQTARSAMTTRSTCSACTASAD